MVRESSRHPAAVEAVDGGGGGAVAVAAPTPAAARVPFRWREAALGLIMASPPFAVVLLLIALPAIQAALFTLGIVPGNNVAFSTGMHIISSERPTLEVYRQLLASPFFRADVAITAIVTGWSVVLVLVIGYVLSLYVRFASGWLPNAVRSLYLLPMFIPVVIASYALITFYVQRGELQALLHSVGLGYGEVIYHANGIIIGQVWASIPFAVLMLGSGLDGIPQELIEAAQDVGAGPVRILWRIILPLNLVPALIVATFTFIGVVGSFTIPFLLGPNAPQMMGVAMNAYFVSYQQPQAAAAMAVLTFLACAAAGVIYVWGTSRTGHAAG
ncbi:MAG TPA: ABC transporter permease subunit [Thermomicrobiales bacterium]|nr:ABC transporter permease subunit [Thermomicrobiales bacterium]